MRHVVRELCFFGLGPILVTLLCLFGIVGGFTAAEALVPLYAIGLIFGVTALGMYGFALLFRAIRWLLSGPRDGLRGNRRPQIADS